MTVLWFSHRDGLMSFLPPQGIFSCALGHSLCCPSSLKLWLQGEVHGIRCLTSSLLGTCSRLSPFSGTRTAFEGVWTPLGWGPHYSGWHTSPHWTFGSCLKLLLFLLPCWLYGLQLLGMCSAIGDSLRLPSLLGRACLSLELSLFLGSLIGSVKVIIYLFF